MKKKFSIWLNIVTICLCMCAIAIGVYAATSATLTVSGQVGFEAHGVEMTITGTLSGFVSEANVDTATATETRTLNTVTLGGDEKVTKGVMSFADSANAESGTDVYFTDLVMDEEGTVPEIELNLTFTNTSKFKVRATVNALTAQGVTITYDKTSLTLDENNGTGTLKVTFALVDQENSLSTAVNMETVTSTTPLVTFTKFTGYEDGEYFVDSTTKMLSVYMGHGTADDYQYVDDYDVSYEERIQWQAFAVLGEGDTYTKPSFVTSTMDAHTPANTTEKWYSLNGADMTNVDYTGHTFWFIQKYVTAGGYVGDPEDINWDYSYITGQVFNASSSDGNNYANSTITSDIYDYVNGTYLTATGISSTDYYTQSITERAVNETYTTNYSGTAGTQDCSFKSKLWLISDAELGLLNGAAVSTGTTYANAKTYGIGNTTGGADGGGANWWLRSPSSGYSNNAQSVVHLGYFSYNSVRSDPGVRAAFQISI